MILLIVIYDLLTDFYINIRIGILIFLLLNCQYLESVPKPKPLPEYQLSRMKLFNYNTNSQYCVNINDRLLWDIG